MRFAFSRRNLAAPAVLALLLQGCDRGGADGGASGDAAMLKVLHGSEAVAAPHVTLTMIYLDGDLPPVVMPIPLRHAAFGRTPVLSHPGSDLVIERPVLVLGWDKTPLIYTSSNARVRITGVEGGPAEETVAVRSDGFGGGMSSATTLDLGGLPPQTVPGIVGVEFVVDVAESRERILRRVEEHPETPLFRIALARFLAAFPVASARDGERAVREAEAAIALAGKASLTDLMTLADAHAEAGDFEEAVRALKRAMEEETQEWQDELLRESLRRFERSEAQPHA